MEKILKEVFEPHPDIIPYLQRAVGSSSPGKHARSVCSFWWGMGGTVRAR